MKIQATTSSKFMKRSRRVDNPVTISASWTRTPFPNKMRPCLYMSTPDGFDFTIELTHANAKLLVADLQARIDELATKYPSEIE